MNAWILGARLRTIPASIAPVVVGTAAAAGMNGADMNAGESLFKGLILWRFIAALVVSIALQIGVNYANDYSDGVRGTDDDRTGPQRLVASGLKPAKQVKAAAFISFGVAAIAGLTLAAVTTWWLLLVGVLAIAAAWFYTGGPRPYGYAGLGELFVFVFFGVVATTGSAFVQTERITPLLFFVSLPIGLFAVALLIINNLRDIPTDKEVGKNTLAVRLGDQKTRIFYVLTMTLPFVMVPFIAGLSERPLAALALLVVVLARYPVQKVLEGARGAGLIPLLASTSRIQLLFAVLFSVGLFIGG